MILNGAQRGGAKALAVHLLNAEDNDHVEVHSVVGFLSDDVTGAFKEVQAIAKGTKCSQPFFSVSLSPPADVSVSIEVYEKAIQKVEDKHGLQGQPRVIVFHEKEGRRHAHAVWSRIDAATMTAKNLPHFKTKLRDVSRELFFQHQWQMPKGLMDSAARNPTNVTLAEWQSAKRRGRNAIDQKKLIQECWAASDSKEAFQAALSERGYILAKGDRRSHVIVSHDGEVFAVARATGQKAKEVRERLGKMEGLPSVEAALMRHKQAVSGQFKRMVGELRSGLSAKRSALDKQRSDMIAQHRKERTMLQKGQTARWQKEAQARARRFKQGLGGLWQHLTGEYKRIQASNEQEAYQTLQRDKSQKQTLINAQLKDRRTLETQRITLRQATLGLVQDLKTDRDRLIAKLTEPRQKKPTLRRRKKQRQDEIIDQGPELEL